jgi:hypothetical protein
MQSKQWRRRQDNPERHPKDLPAHPLGRRCRLKPSGVSDLDGGALGVPDRCRGVEFVLASVAEPLHEPVDTVLVEFVVLCEVTCDIQQSEAWLGGFETRAMGEQSEGQLIVVGVGAESLDRPVRWR